jgi:hypothetical protein
MIRNLKALGLALGAVFAFSAMAASSASAVDTLTGPLGNFTVTATNLDAGVHNIHQFKITGPNTTVECTSAHFLSTPVTSGISTITVTPTYKGTKGITPHTTHCNSSVGTADIDMNGCDYILTGHTTGHDPVGTAHGTISIVCPENKEITVTLTEVGVTLHIHPQTPTTGGVTYTNTGTNQVTVKATVTGITYSCKPAFVCGLGGIPSEGNDADYVGSVVASSTPGNLSVSTS